MNNNSEIKIIRLPDYKYISRDIRDVNSYYDYNKEILMPRISFGRILIENEQGLQGLLDLNGQLYIPCLYDRIDLYTDRFIKISRLDETDKRYYGVLDVSGNNIIPCECTEIIVYGGYKDKKMDRLIYCLNDKWGVSSIEGDTIVPAVFDKLRVCFLHVDDNEVMVFIVSRDNLWGAYDIYGDELISCDKDNVKCFPEQQYQKPELLIFEAKGKKIPVTYRGHWLKDSWYQREINGFVASEKPVFLEKNDNSSNDRHNEDCYKKAASSQLPGKFTTIYYDETGKIIRPRMGYQDENGATILANEHSFIRPAGKRLMVAQHYLNLFSDIVQLYDETGKTIFKEELNDVIVTNTGKIACSPFDWEKVEYLDYMYFYDEDKNTYSKITEYNYISRSCLVAPYYIAMIYGLNDRTTYGLVDGDGNIVVAVEYTFFLNANDYLTDNSILASKDECWYLIRVCQK